ncbi:hypothetical protein R6Q59_015921 [Mikania micrantha]
MAKVAIRHKTQSKSHFFKLKNIVSIFTFIILFTSTVSLYFYSHNLSIYTDYNDRNFIFLICNGILAFLFIISDSTRVSLPKENQTVGVYEIKHQTLIISSAMEQVPVIEEQEEEIDKHGDEIEKLVCVPCDHDDVLSIVQDEIDDQMEFDDAVDTEEFNKKCEDFIREMKERLKSESTHCQKNLAIYF